MQESNTKGHAQKLRQRIICEYVWEPRPDVRVPGYNKNTKKNMNPIAVHTEVTTWFGEEVLNFIQEAIHYEAITRRYEKNITGTMLPGQSEYSVQKQEHPSAY